MGMFDVDYDVLIWQMLPVRLRQAIQYAWLKCLVSPVKWIYGVFKGNRNDNLYNLAHNGQVCFLEGALNDRFDNVSRGIFISDPMYVDPVFIYQAAENKPVYIWQASEVIGGAPNAEAVYVWQASECYSGGGIQFIVNVPAAVYAALDVNELKALINKYRLVSKSTYTIVTY